MLSRRLRVDKLDLQQKLERSQRLVTASTQKVASVQMQLGALQSQNQVWLGPIPPPISPQHRHPIERRPRRLGFWFEAMISEGQVGMGYLRFVRNPITMHAGVACIMRSDACDKGRRRRRSGTIWKQQS